MVNLIEKLENRQEWLSIVGLGYVGLPLAVAFSKKLNVIGFDINVRKIEAYQAGIDKTNEVGSDLLKNTDLLYTHNEADLKKAKFHIVAVPTPINDDKTPDLKPVIGASEVVGRNLTKGSIVVYESTVYPGLTEELCVGILEKCSGLKCGTDFKVGYSPERINPGDKVHRLESIVKVVSGMDEASLDIIARVYELIVDAGVHRAESIKVAEAAKVIENSQRDINIAFMNELSLIFNKLGIDTEAVLEAAGTKWNFLKFTPGLVGGHCIGVDPYYLTYKAEAIGYHSQIILAGRKINDGMGKYIAENMVKKLIQSNRLVHGAKVAILGITFKENCPDSRNTKVVDIIHELEEYCVQIQVVDPVADPVDVKAEYGIELYNLDELQAVDGVIVAVAHAEFTGLKLTDIASMYRTSNKSTVYSEVAATLEQDCNYNKKVLIDVKGIFDKKEAETLNFLYWRL